MSSTNTKTQTASPSPRAMKGRKAPIVTMHEKPERRDSDTPQLMHKPFATKLAAYRIEMR